VGFVGLEQKSEAESERERPRARETTKTTSKSRERAGVMKVPSNKSKTTGAEAALEFVKKRAHPRFGRNKA
jgi:hypothetical protein